eukprot:6180971-Pleurochrysis_carterae.AAC.6
MPAHAFRYPVLLGCQLPRFFHSFEFLPSRSSARAVACGLLSRLTLSRHSASALVSILRRFASSFWKFRLYLDEACSENLFGLDAPNLQSVIRTACSPTNEQPHPSALWLLQLTKSRTSTNTGQRIMPHLYRWRVLIFARLSIVHRHKWSAEGGLLSDLLLKACMMRDAPADGFRLIACCAVTAALNYSMYIAVRRETSAYCNALFQRIVLAKKFSGKAHAAALSYQQGSGSHLTPLATAA